MLNGKPVTAIIPARGGSKGIPGKNLRVLAGVTLLERAIRLGKSSGNIDRVLVTTDDPEMHEIAGRYGAAAPALRPTELSGDDVATAPVITHLIEEAGINEGYLLLLQPTSPLRTKADLEGILALLAAHPDAPAAVSLSAHEEPHPAKLQTIDGEGHVTPFLGEGYEGARQSLAPVYALNGAFYLIDRDVFLAEQRFLVAGTLPYLMPPERSINLDTMMDWHILEALIAKGICTVEDL